MPAEGIKSIFLSAVFNCLIYLIIVINIMYVMRNLLIFFLFIIFPVYLSGAAYTADNSVIKGVVRDSQGTPLAGASVTIENTFLGFHTAADGSFSFKGLKPGSYIIKASFIGFESETKTVTLSGEANVNFILKTGSFLTEDVFISATRAGDKSPLAYSSVNGQALKNMNSGPDLPFLLTLTPSLIETSEAGNGVGYTSLRVRGSDGSRINVTIDGIPLNDPESQQVFWVDLPDLASSVDNIQVQRGAGTSSNGAGAFGATISIQTKSPENEPFAEVNSSYGSFNTMKNTISAGTGLLAGKYSVQMRYSDLKSDGFIERTGSAHRSAFISGQYRTSKSSLKANIILGEEHTGIGWWGVPAEKLAENRRYNPAGEYTDESGTTRYYDNESDNYTQNHYQLIYGLSINKYLTLNAALHYTKGKGYYEEYREDQDLTDYGITPFLIGDTLLSATDMIRRKWLSNDFYGSVYSLKYKNERIEAVAGGGINLYEGDHFGRIIWMRNAGTTEKDYNWYLNKSRKGEVSIYGKVNYSLSNRLAIFGDIQYRGISYRMRGLDDDLKDISQEHSFRFFNPKAGLFYSINQDQDAYISFAAVNREPTRTDFKEASGDAEATPKSERLYDTEMGYKLRREKGSFAVNFYGMIYDNQLVPTGELSNVGYPIMTNVEKSSRLGVEFSAGIKPIDFIEWNLNLTISRNKIQNFREYYTEYDTTDWSSSYKSKDLGEVDIAYSPSLTGTSDLGFTLAKSIRLHLISKYVGRQYIDNTMDSERKLDPYFVNNIRFDFSKKLKNTLDLHVQFLVNNVLNEEYESNGYGGNWYESGREKSWSYYFPQAGINYLLRVGLMF